MRVIWLGHGANGSVQLTIRSESRQSPTWKRQIRNESHRPEKGQVHFRRYSDYDIDLLWDRNLGHLTLERWRNHVLFPGPIPIGVVPRCQNLRPRLFRS